MATLEDPSVPLVVYLSRGFICSYGTGVTLSIDIGIHSGVSRVRKRSVSGGGGGDSGVNIPWLFLGIRIYYDSSLLNCHTYRLLYPSSIHSRRLYQRIVVGISIFPNRRCQRLFPLYRSRSFGRLAVFPAF